MSVRRIVALLALVALLGGAVAEAKTVRGNNRDNKLSGTAKNDRIDGRGGDDSSASRSRSGRDGSRSSATRRSAGRTGCTARRTGRFPATGPGDA